MSLPSGREITALKQAKGQSEMLSFNKCFIMLCTKVTEEECLSRSLFGDRKWRLDYLKEITPGDIGFLFNMSTNELIGPFVAKSEAQLDIEENAWFGEFGAQVRVESLGEIKRLGGADGLLVLAGVPLDNLSSRVVVPLFPVHSHHVGERLLHAFGGDMQNEL